MDIYVIVLRIVHIFAGVFWVGAAWMIAGFLNPTAAQTGPAGQPYMQKLFQGRLSMVISAAAGLNVLAGALLYWKDSAGFNLVWIGTPTGIGFTSGAVFAIIAFVIGFGVTRPASEKMSALGAAIQAGGKPPTPEQAAAMQAVVARLNQAALWTAILVAVALFFMATARYY
jgi:multisubunit Na+/H+ antiporter MnhC subunit